MRIYDLILDSCVHLTNITCNILSRITMKVIVVVITLVGMVVVVMMIKMIAIKAE